MSATATLEEHRAKCLAAVAEVLTESVIDAAPFNRRGLYTNKLLGKFGFVPYLLGKSQAKAQAGGLPEQFLFAVTPSHVLVLEYKARGRMRDRYEVGQELAAWDRGDIAVTWQDGPPYQIDVTVESSGGDEPILCRCGRTAWSEEVLKLMADPSATG